MIWPILMEERALKDVFEGFQSSPIARIPIYNIHDIASGMTVDRD